jgi:hypothetical protein
LVIHKYIIEKYLNNEIIKENMSLLIKEFPEIMKTRLHVALMSTQYKPYDIASLLIAKCLFEIKDDEVLIKTVKEMLSDKKYDSDIAIVQLREVIKGRRYYPPITKSNISTVEPGIEVIPKDKSGIFGRLKK